MKTVCTIGAIALTASVVSGCGGSSGAPMTQNPPVASPPGASDPSNPPASQGPESMNASDLIAFANDGGTTKVIQGTPYFNDQLVAERTITGVERTTRSGTFDGRPVTVAVDRLPGSEIGLLQYRLGDEMAVFSVIGDAITSIDMPSGAYNGFMDLTYTMDGGAVAALSGGISMTLNMTTGDVAIGGIAGNNPNVIEIFGDAVVSGGEFTDPNLVVRLRDSDGVFIRDEQGVLRGVLASGTDTNAIFGTIVVDNSPNAFSLDGGFNAIHDASIPVRP